MSNLHPQWMMLADLRDELREVSPEAAGVGFKLLQEFFFRRQSIPDDDAAIARAAGIRPCRWRRLQAQFPDFFRRMRAISASGRGRATEKAVAQFFGREG